MDSYYKVNLFGVAIQKKNFVLIFITSNYTVGDGKMYWSRDKIINLVYRFLFGIDSHRKVNLFGVVIQKKANKQTSY